MSGGERFDEDSPFATSEQGQIFHAICFCLPDKRIMMILVSNRFAGLLLSLLFALSLATGAHAQLTEHCTVSVLNRTVQVKPDGSWVLPNIPANFGQVRARATCVENGITRSGQSDLFSVPANGAVNLPTVQLGAVAQIPSSLTLSAPTTTLPTVGATTQIVVTAKFPDGSTKNVTAASAGTNYTNSNAKVATVTPDGLVTAVSSGTVIISALNEGALGLIRIQVALSGGDADGDGISDDIEIANGLNPNDPTDGFADPDNDGLTNKQELVDFGTDRLAADTDGDGINDGEEVTPGKDGFVTSPLLRDTDGDGVSDSAEIAAGSDPTDPNSRPGLTALQVSPPNLTLTVNTILGEASQRLRVTGRRADGSTVDLTADPGTNYASSDLNICNFGAERGRVFASANGSCTITITNSGLSTQVTVTVQTFAPTALSFVSIPGFANSVDVNGDFAYVAAGSAGLQIVDVTDHSHPRIVASQALPGNANDIIVVGDIAYVAAGSAGLQILDVGDPLHPILVGAVDTSGDAWDVGVQGTLAFVADGSAGLQVIDVSNPAAPKLVGTVDTPGVAKGVDVAPNQPFAVVADASGGLQVIDVTDPTHPAIIGSVSTGGDARDVVLNGDFAFVAAYTQSFTSVDLSDPRHPVVRASTPSSTGGFLQDVVVMGQFALGADVFFVNGVPIIDVSTPETPVPRAILDFSAFRDDEGTGIAADNRYIYLTTMHLSREENGAVGDTRLYIGQYLVIEDTVGIPPTVSITTPASGDTLIEGQTITLHADATDDISVAAVSFLVNGQVIFTDTAAPFETSFPVPIGASSLTLSAIATDFGGNTGTAENVGVNVIPDPGTTVKGQMVDSDGNPLAAATVTCAGISGLSTSTGEFSLADVPTVKTITGAIQCQAIFTALDGTKLRGASDPVPPVRAGTTNVGQIRLASCRFSGLISWWPGDGNANDIEDGNGGTLQGDATFAPGMVKQGFLLDGIDDFVNVGNASNLQVSASDFTVDAWVLFNALSHPPGGGGISPPGDMSIVDKMSASGANNDGWRLIKQDDGRFWFCLGGGSGNNGCVLGGPLAVRSTTIATVGVWFHIAAVKSSSAISIYVNGRLEDSKALGFFTDTHSADLLIGSSNTRYGARLNGLVDEAEIYNRVLSQAEIQAIFAAGSGEKCKP